MKNEHEQFVLINDSERTICHICVRDAKLGHYCVYPNLFSRADF